jgi:hypothetical protein
LEHPVKTVDWNAAFLAGMNGALQVYDSILKQKPAEKSAFLEDLRLRREDGQLESVVTGLVQRRCK